MAREAEEDGPTRPLKHLHSHQALQGHPEQQRNSADTETSRRNHSSTDKEVREHQEATADPERAIPRRDHRPYDLRRFSIGTSSFRTLT